MNDENIQISDITVNEKSETSKQDVKDIKLNLLASPPLLNRIVGLSASESEDLSYIGLSTSHLKDVMIEVNRYLLSSGASIAYGGDLRANGLTEILIELIDRYKFNEADQSSRLRSYLAFPFSLSLEKEKMASLAQRINFLKIPPPDDIMPLDLNKFISPADPKNSLMLSRCLTEMRETMENDCDARIFLGGRNIGYKGIAPGVLEEVMISLKNKTPIYLIGGYGGATGSLVSHLNEKKDLVNQLNVIKESQEFLLLQAEYTKHGKIDVMNWPEELLQLLSDWQYLSDLNGLSVDENLKLSNSINTYEIIYYILKGLVTKLKY